MLNIPRRHTVTFQTLACTAAIALAGCNHSPSDAAKKPGNKGGIAPAALLESALDLLREADRSPEIHRIAAQRLNQYLDRTDASQTNVADLDQSVEEFLDQRPLLLKAQLEKLKLKRFDQNDSVHLESCSLHRDIVRHVISGRSDDRSKALALFDWVVRNIQVIPTASRRNLLPTWFLRMDPDGNQQIGQDEWPASGIAEFHKRDLDQNGVITGQEVAELMLLPPRITLILGQGTHYERSWVFMELLRQADIPSAILGYELTLPDNSMQYNPWLVAALIEDDFLLFDAAIGLPVPGPGGEGVATLRQVVAQPALIRQLDISEENPYPVDQEKLKKLVLMIESSYLNWAPRMEFLESRLAGENRVVLYTDLTQLRRRMQQVAGPAVDIDLWPLPLLVERRIIGADERSASYRDLLQKMMFPYLALPDVIEARFAQLRGDYEKAIKTYMHRRLELASKDLGNLPPEARPGIANWVREDVTYFMGVLKFEQGDQDVAEDWFSARYLEIYKSGRWVTGAWYHLGRDAENRGDTAAAIAYYTRDDYTPNGVGAKLRAKRLGWSPPPNATRQKTESDAAESDATQQKDAGKSSNPPEAPAPAAPHQNDE